MSDQGEVHASQTDRQQAFLGSGGLRKLRGVLGFSPAKKILDPTDLP